MTIRETMKFLIRCLHHVKSRNFMKMKSYRMPVQYIIGEWDFRDITLKLVPPIFIPRPETEIIVDIILKRLSGLHDDNHEILEIGCGSGAISLALAHSSNKVHYFPLINWLNSY